MRLLIHKALCNYSLTLQTIKTRFESCPHLSPQAARARSPVLRPAGCERLPKPALPWDGARCQASGPHISTLGRLQVATRPQLSVTAPMIMFSRLRPIRRHDPSVQPAATSQDPSGRVQPAATNGPEARVPPSLPAGTAAAPSRSPSWSPGFSSRVHLPESGHVTPRSARSCQCGQGETLNSHFCSMLKEFQKIFLFDRKPKAEQQNMQRWGWEATQSFKTLQGEKLFVNVPQKQEYR